MQGIYYLSRWQLKNKHTQNQQQYLGMQNAFGVDGVSFTLFKLFV